MSERLPADGGQLLGLKPTPPPALTIRERAGMYAGIGYCSFVAIGIWLVLPLLLIAAIASWVSGSLLFIGIWAALLVVYVLALLPLAIGASKQAAGAVREPAATSLDEVDVPGQPPTAPS